MSDEDTQDSLPRERPSETRARSVIKIGACTSTAGIALAVTGDNDLSRWLAVVGIVLLVWGLHRFGRLGVDRPSESNPSP